MYDSRMSKRECYEEGQKDAMKKFVELVDKELIPFRYHRISVFDVLEFAKQVLNDMEKR